MNIDDVVDFVRNKGWPIVKDNVIPRVKRIVASVIKKTIHFVCTASMKVKELWGSGRNGKCGVVACVFFVLLVLSRLFNGCDNEQEVISFEESDFPLTKTNAGMFYDGEEVRLHENNDSVKYIQALPNLRKIPETLHSPDVRLCGSMNPAFKEDIYRQVGHAYFNDASDNYHCIIDQAGDGFVVVVPNSKFMYGDFEAYITTDQKYVDRQSLKTGYYMFEGREMIPQIDGTEKAMFTYVELDEESNRYAIEALKYNISAINATAEENRKRARLAQEAYDQKKIRDCQEAVANKMKEYKFSLNIENRVHFRKSDMTSQHAVQFEGVLENHSGYAVNYQRLKKALEQNDAKELMAELKVPSCTDCTEAGEVAVEIFESLKVHLKITTVPRYFLVSVGDRFDPEKRSCYLKTENYYNGIWKRMKEELYLIDPDDKDILKIVRNNNVDAFVKMWQEKYGE